MVKKPAKGKAKGTKARRPDVIQPESWTGYPAKKPCDCPATALGKAAGGGKSAS
jgi:hypothetical protein